MSQLLSTPARAACTVLVAVAHQDACGKERCQEFILEDIYPRCNTDRNHKKYIMRNYLSISLPAGYGLASWCSLSCTQETSKKEMFSQFVMLVAGDFGVAGLTRDGVVELQRKASYLSISLSEDRMNNMIFVIIHVVK